MVVKAALIAAAALSISGQANARDADILTVAGGVVCLSPFKLSEAIKASNRGDSKWVTELGCVTLAENHKAILINQYAGLADPWQVRLQFENGTAVTAWGYAPSFKTKSGRPFWKQRR